MARILLLIILIITSTVTFGQKLLKTLIKENEKSVFLIQCLNERNEIVSTGSGFFIDKSGLAFTNVHVIKDAYKAKIKTVDGKFYEVEKIVDYNPNLDIAKIKIRNSASILFPSVKIAKEKSGKGDEVFAIGNPDGLDNSVSTGIISSIRLIANYGECYQITAPISPGSSGGALFNMNGEVIGMTTFGQIDPNRLNQNLNFAININNAKYLNKSLNLTIEKAYKEIAYEDFIPAFMKAELSGNFNRALEICDQQVMRKPSNWLAYHFRGYLFFTKGEYSEAEKDLKKAIQLNPTNNLKDMDYVGLGKIYRRSGFYEQSKDAYLEALKINDKDAACYCNLAVLAYEWLGPENELVEKSYFMALQIDSTSCSFGLKKMAEKSMNEKNFEKAVKLFTMSIEAEKDKTLIVNEYYNRGCCNYSLKNFKAAIEDFKQCLLLMPNDYQSYLWIGYCQISLGKKIDACAAFNKANEININITKSSKAAEQIQKDIETYCK